MIAPALGYTTAAPPRFICLGPPLASPRVRYRQACFTYKFTYLSNAITSTARNNQGFSSVRYYCSTTNRSYPEAAHEAALGYRGTLDLLQRGVHVHAECPRTNCHVVEKNIILACRGSSASDEADNMPRNMRYQRRPRLTQTCNLCAPSVSVQARRRDRGDTTAY